MVVVEVVGTGDIGAVGEGGMVVDGGWGCGMREVVSCCV